jgi:hypothetical protein
MREYELYIPLFYNEGPEVEPHKISELKKRLVQRFGGLTHFPQENEGLWKVGPFTYRDKIIILRVLAPAEEDTSDFFSDLKTHIKKEWSQDQVLIVSRAVQLI